MANKFLTNIELEAGLVDVNGNTGTSGQILSSTGSGVDWIENSSTATSAEKVSLEVRFEEAVSKGDPVYVSGFHGSNGPVKVSKARSDDSDKMPAFGLADDDYAQNAEGHAVSLGNMDDIDTSSYSIGDTLYVAPTGGLTNTKPTYSNLIQNVGTVSRSNQNNGSIEVTATGRSNDVPNLTTGKIWVGDGNTVESTVVHLDEVNERMGIGTTSPGYKLDVNGNVSATVYNAGAVVLSTRAGKADLYGYSGPTLTYYNGTAIVPALTVDYGNVGIGTTNPGYKLEVNSGTTNNIAKFVSSDGGGLITVKDSSGEVAFSNVGNDIFLKTSSSQTNQMSILNSGNVGIGTTSPGHKLTVNAANNTTAVGIDFPSAHFNFSANSTSGYTSNFRLDDVGMDIGHDSTARSLNLQTGNLDRVTILGNGNVGIGTTSPGAKLEIGGSSEPGIRLRETGGSNYYDIKTDGSIAWFGDQANGMKNLVVTAGGGAEIRTNGNLVAFKVENIAPAGSLYIKGTTGNVGIGTTSPGTKLDVAGNANISDTLAIGSLSTVPTASLGRALNIQVLANSSGTTVAQWLDVDRTITTNSTSANTYGMLLRNASTTTSTANDGNIYGAQIIGRHQGTGGINSAMGVRGTADINTTGTITTTGSLWGAYNEGQVTNGSVTFSNSGIYGTASIAQVLGSGTVNITTRGIVGVGSVGRINNVNATVNRVVAGEFELDLQNGATEQAHVISLNTYNITSPTNLSIDEFAYIYLGEDVAIPTTVTDNAYFIKSLTSLPSELAGSIEATSFIKTGGTSSQFLKADGSIDSTSYAPATGGSYLPLAGGTMTGDFTVDSAMTVEVGGDTVIEGGLEAQSDASFAGSVGIGTTSPLAKTHIKASNANGDSAASGTLIVEQGSSPSIQLLSANSQTQTIKFADPQSSQIGRISYSHPSDAMFFVTNGTERMRMTSDGNVGIGTTSPTAKLHIQHGGGAGSGLYVKSNVNRSKITVADNDSAAYVVAEGGKASYGTADSLSANNLTIETSGNVGIGTTNPGARLDVAGAGNAILIRRSNGFASIKASSDNGGNLILDSFSTAGGVFINHYVNRPVYIATGGGNVGIGTTSPGYKLDVNGVINVSDNNPIRSSNEIMIRRTNSTNLLRIGSGDTSDETQFYAGGSERMRITSTGNVGIGTTSPSAKLHIEASDPRIKIVDADGTNWQSEVFTQGGSLKLQARNGTNFGNISFQGDNGTTQSEYARFNSVGNLGIGTTSPGEKLEVSGNIKFTSNGNQLRNSAGNNILNDSSNLITIGNGATSTVYAIGNVGIGVTTPRAKLDVAGGVKVADDTDTAGANKVGTLRYRTSGNNSYVDMCMQTGASTYEWVNVVQNNW